MIYIRTALSLSSLFWPEFVEIDGAVFIAAELARTGSKPTDFPNQTEAELFINHIHILDHFNHDAALEGGEDRFWEEQNHSDFISACDLGNRIAAMWASKLLVDYPNYNFRVYYSQQDNPIVRFQRVRPGEPTWIDEQASSKQIGAGEIIVYKTIELRKQIRQILLPENFSELCGP
jgi:hypothetical protein